MRPGKTSRLEKILDPRDGRAVCVAADHGWMSDLTDNVINLRFITESVVKGGADGILMSMGQAMRLGHLLQGRQAPALLIRADWMNYPRLEGGNVKNAVPVQALKRVAAGTARDAMNLGASGITIYYFIGFSDENEAKNIESLAIFARECSRIGLPCIIEPIAVGARVTDANIADLLIASARIAVEIGADMLKIPYTGDVDSFSKLVQGAGVPVLMLGGPKFNNPDDALELVKEGLVAGAAGVVFGRNVTQAKDPELMVRELRAIIHE